MTNRLSRHTFDGWLVFSCKVREAFSTAMRTDAHTLRMLLYEAMPF